MYTWQQCQGQEEVGPAVREEDLMGVGLQQYPHSPAPEEVFTIAPPMFQPSLPLNSYPSTLLQYSSQHVTFTILANFSLYHVTLFHFPHGIVEQLNQGCIALSLSIIMTISCSFLIPIDCFRQSQLTCLAICNSPRYHILWVRKISPIFIFFFLSPRALMLSFQTQV